MNILHFQKQNNILTKMSVPRGEFLEIAIHTSSQSI
jgi:hypothetical protein